MRWRRGRRAPAGIRCGPEAVGAVLGGPIEFVELEHHPRVTIPAAVCPSLRDEFRLPIHSRHQRRGEFYELRAFWLRRAGKLGWKVFPFRVRVKRSLSVIFFNVRARMLSCRTVCFVRPFFTTGIRADGAERFFDMTSSDNVTGMAGPYVSRKRCSRWNRSRLTVSSSSAIAPFPTPSPATGSLPTRVRIRGNPCRIRWGFTRGIRVGFIPGITLDDHPLQLTKSLLREAVGGSAGIPDSLGHKPVDTSGRPRWPASVAAGGRCRCSRHHDPSPPSAFVHLFYLLSGIVIVSRAWRCRGWIVDQQNQCGGGAENRRRHAEIFAQKNGGYFYCVRCVAES